MSDLSFLIQTQKEVEFDEIYFKKCIEQENHKQKSLISSNSQPKGPLSREIKINANFIPNQRKAQSPSSYNIKNLPSLEKEGSDSNEVLYKASMRIEALDENQKRLQQKLTKQLSALHIQISNKKSEYSELMLELNEIKKQINMSKKAIGEVLSEITSVDK